MMVMMIKIHKAHGDDDDDGDDDNGSRAQFEILFDRALSSICSLIWLTFAADVCLGFCAVV